MSDTTQAMSLPSKDLSLEAVRGLASITVFIWHFFLAFDPNFLFDPDRGVVGMPYFAFFHGTAAVDLFFVLSGFVLTRRFFETGDRDLLITGAMKRWFRLIPVVLISVLSSWTCFHFGLYAYEQAAQMSQSSWLQLCGGAHYPPVDPSFLSAFWQGFFDAIIRGEANFNSNLWTLHIEFWGSLLAFAFAWGVRQLHGEAPFVWLLVLIVGGVVSFIDLHYLAFILGPLLAAYGSRLRPVGVKGGLPLLIAGLIFLGYRAPIGFYEVMQPLAAIPRDTLYVLFSLAGSALVILSCITWPALNESMQSRLSRFLGQISFPLYALHIVTICSLGSAVFVFMGSSDLFYAKLFTAMILVPTTVALAYLLSLVDQAWVRRLNRFVAQRYGRLRKACA
ncbi:MAG: acyltransferase [Alphaproteobacteria bacterium]|nr:acyltransferase [Alphaproteobacteria bacterium]